MDWDEAKKKTVIEEFCIVCGKPAIKFKDNRWFCQKHSELKQRRRIPRYSGQSKTPYGQYENR